MGKRQVFRNILTALALPALESSEVEETHQEPEPGHTQARNKVQTAQQEGSCLLAGDTLPPPPCTDILGDVLAPEEPQECTQDSWGTLPEPQGHGPAGRGALWKHCRKAPSLEFGEAQEPGQPIPGGLLGP